MCGSLCVVRRALRCAVCVAWCVSSNALAYTPVRKGVGSNPTAVTRVACCALRVARCVLHVAVCMLLVACCVLSGVSCVLRHACWVFACAKGVPNLA